MLNRTAIATPIENQDLRSALSLFATGVAVVTGCDRDGRLVAATINSFASVSLNPPLVLFNFSKSSSRFDDMTRMVRYSINVLKSDQMNMVSAFATNDAAQWQKLIGVDADMTPCLDCALARFTCEPYETYGGGDHAILVGRVIGFESDRDGHALVFFNHAYQAIKS